MNNTSTTTYQSNGQARTKVNIKPDTDFNSTGENPFPTQVFTSIFGNLIKECATALNFPVEYTATAIICAVATAVGKSVKLKVKSGWYEFGAFFFALVGDAGANKSHPLAAAFKPYEEMDRKAIQQFARGNQEYEEYQALSKKDKKDIEQKDKPILIKNILHNFTSEIIVQRLVDNPYGCCVVSDELETHLEGMNNYSKVDQSSTYLTMWSNKATSVDRVGKTVPLWLPAPYLNIIGTIQRRILPRLFTAKKSDSGFLQRYLFAFPDYTEKAAINDNELNESLLEQYASWIEKCRAEHPINIDTNTGKPLSKIFHWSPEAKTFFYQWQCENTRKVNEHSENLRGEVLSKFDIHFVRLSLVMQVMIDYKTCEISLQAAQAAADLCNYYENCALKVLVQLEKVDSLEGLPQAKINLYNALPAKEIFTTAHANDIGIQFEVSTKTIQRFLNEEKLFVKIDHGKYTKKQKK